MRAADRFTGPSEAFDAVLETPRNPHLITHHVIAPPRLHVDGLALGYMGLKDHNTPRGDLVGQSLVERTDELAYGPTLCLWELEDRGWEIAGRRRPARGSEAAQNRANWQLALAMSRVLAGQFKFSRCTRGFVEGI